MIKGIENLSPLKPENWHKVRDISIPVDLHRSNGKVTAKANIHGALAFTGDARALRVYDDNYPGAFDRLLGLVSSADKPLSEGLKRFRLEQEGISYRAQLGTNASTNDLQLRVLPSEVPTLHELDMPDAWRSLLLDEDLLNGGLLLMVAPNGQGKTTTASSVVRTRLESFAGFANTIEDPIELPLQGAWGVGGICYQRPVDTQLNAEHPGDGYYHALIDSLRQFPATSGGATILFVGEIRDAKTAAETLKAASNGHLVIATLHAKSVESAVRRMITLCSAGPDALDQDSVRGMMSEALKGVFHQRLMWKHEGEGWSSAKVTGSVLWSDGYFSAVAKALRENHMDALHHIVQIQTDALKSYGTTQTNLRAAEVLGALSIDHATGREVTTA